MSRWFALVSLLALVCVAPAHAAARHAFAPATPVTGVVNLNTATDAELRTLPGIGPTKAQRIVAHRARQKFASIDQLMKVKGIGRKTFRKLKPHLAVSGPSTLKKMPREKATEPRQGAAGAMPSDAEPQASAGG